MSENTLDIPGVKEVDLDGDPGLAFGSFQFEQCHIIKILERKDIVALLFYQAEFNDVDLSVLSALPLKKINILHGNFSDKELSQLKNINTLRSLKLFDVNVSDLALAVYVDENPLVKVT